MGNIPTELAELQSRASTDRRSAFKVPDRYPHLYDLVGPGTPFSNSEDFYSEQNLPLLRTYANLAGMSVQDMSNLLDKLLDGKQDFLDKALTMRIDGKDVPLTNPITDLPLFGGDIGKARSGPEFAVPENPRAVNAMLPQRPAEQLDDIDAHINAGLGKADQQGVFIPNRKQTVAALKSLLNTSNTANRPVHDLDFQITNHSLWRESLQGALNNALIEKFGEEQGTHYVEALKKNPNIMRDIAYAHMHEGGALETEAVAATIDNNLRYANVLKNQTSNLPKGEQPYHPISGSLLKEYGTGLVTNRAEAREVEELPDGSWKKVTEPHREDANYKLVRTTDIFARYENGTLSKNEAIDLLGPKCFKQQGLVEFKDVITTTWLDLEGIAGQDVVDKKHLKQLSDAIDSGNLPGVTHEMVEECKQRQTQGRFSYRQMMAELQAEVENIKTPDKSYIHRRTTSHNLGILAAQAAEDKDFCNQALYAEEIGYKLALCEQQKADMARALTVGDEEGVQKSRNKLIKSMSDTGAHLEALHERRQHDPNAQALWEIVNNTYRNRLVQWGISTPEQLEDIGKLTDIVTPEEYARVMSQPDNTYDHQPDDALEPDGSPLLRRKLGLGKTTVDMAKERMAAFAKGANAVYESARSQKQYFAVASELKQSFEALQAAPNDANAQQAYVEAYGNMRVQIAQELSKDPPPAVLQAFAKLHGKDMAHDLVNLGASKAVSCVALDMRCKRQLGVADEVSKQAGTQAQDTEIQQNASSPRLGEKARIQVQDTVQELLAQGIEQREENAKSQNQLALEAFVEQYGGLGIRFDLVGASPEMSSAGNPPVPYRATRETGATRVPQNR